MSVVGLVGTRVGVATCLSFSVGRVSLAILNGRVGLALGGLLLRLLVFPYKVVERLIGQRSLGVVNEPKLLDSPAKEDTTCKKRGSKGYSDVGSSLDEEQGSGIVSGRAHEPRVGKDDVQNGDSDVGPEAHEVDLPRSEGRQLGWKLLGMVPLQESPDVSARCPQRKQQSEDVVQLPSGEACRSEREQLE